MLTSMVCKYEHFLSSWYQVWSNRMQLNNGDPHRKIWEWAAISQALGERDMLRADRSGCGFAVGKEPLPSLFASFGAQITATDAPSSGDESTPWAESNQHASSLTDVWDRRFISEAEFHKRVAFAHADMRDPDTFPAQPYDFLWSSCAFEHLGSLEAGHQFVVASADRLLKPGGVAVHTTEFNVSSNDETISEGENVIYRKADIERIAGTLRRVCCGMAPVDYDAGLDRFDLEYDYPPWYTHGRKHIKLLVADFVITSVLVIIHKGQGPVAEA
jgi:SAM-dependent methyltransferase